VITDEDPEDNDVYRKIRGSSSGAAGSTIAGRNSVAVVVTISFGASSWPTSVAVVSVPVRSVMMSEDVRGEGALEVQPMGEFWL